MFGKEQIEGNINTIQEQLLFNIDQKLGEIINLLKERDGENNGNIQRTGKIQKAK